MGAHAQGNGGEAARDHVGHQFAPRQNERERTGPESLGQSADQRGIVIGHGGEPVEPTQIRQMDNERIEEGSLLCLENFEHRIRLQRMGG